MPKTQKINFKKILAKHKKNILGFKSKRWNITMFLLLICVAYTTQSYIDTKFNPDVAQATSQHETSKAMEAFAINDSYAIYETDKDNLHYINPGETDAHTFSFGITTLDQILIFKGLKLTKIGKLDDSVFLNAKLLENDVEIAQAKIKNGELNFKNFTSVLQSETTKEYKVAIDFSGDALTGNRFKFQIESPYSLNLYLENDITYSLGDYPISGGYVSVVGSRK